MAAETRTQLKTYFETGDYPTQTQFSNLIDSFFNLTDDSYITKIGTANGSTTGLLSSTDWTTFNSKVTFPGFGTSHVTSAYGDHTHSGVYEPVLGNPSNDGYVLSSTTGGVRSWVAAGGESMVYPGSGIPLSTGDSWDTSITDNSSNWNTAYSWGDHASAGYLTSSVTTLSSLQTIYSGLTGIVKATAGLLSAAIDGTDYLSSSYLLTAGSTSMGTIKYNGTTQVAGQFDGGTTNPSHTTRLNYNGNFYPNNIHITNSGSSNALDISNTSDGVGNYISNQGDGSGLYILNFGPGIGVNITNTATGIPFAIQYSDDYKTKFDVCVTNVSNAIAYLLNTKNTLSTSGSKLLSVQNNTVERFRVTPTTTDIGDIAGGNYSTFESDGTLVFNGNATVFEDLNFSPLSSGGAAVSLPDYVTINSTVHREFTSANNQSCGDSKELPHAYKLSSNLTPHCHIFLKSGESAGTTGVTFTFYWELRQSTGVTNGSLTLSATSTQLTENPNKFDISGTAFAGAAELGAQLYVTIARTAGDAGDVILMTYGVHYEIDTVGSRAITTK